MIVGTVNWDYWLDDVMPSLSGIEIELVTTHIRSSAIEFCEQSYAWRVDMLPVTVNANQRQYLINSPYDDAEIVRVEQAFLNDKELRVTSASALAQRDINFLSHKAIPVNYVQEYTDRMSLYPLANADFNKGLTCKLSLRPSRVANGMNDSIGKRYFEAIAQGTKARLFEMPKKPWSDGNLSVYHRAKFNMMVKMARDEVASGYGRGPKRIVSHY